MPTTTPTEARPVVPIPLHEMLALDYEFATDGSPVAEVRMPVRPEALGFTGNLLSP